MMINEIADVSAAGSRPPTAAVPTERTSTLQLPRCDIDGRRRSCQPRSKLAVSLVATCIALTACNAGDTETEGSASTTTPTAESEVIAGPRPEDVAVIEAYFAAYNDGDTDAVLALLASPAIYTETYGGLRPDPTDGEPIDAAEIGLQLAWNHAQGEILTEADCRPADEQPGAGVTLDCSYTTLDAVVQAVDGAPIPTRTLVTIVDGTITELHHGYGSPDFGTLGRPFQNWLDREHPDIEGAGCCIGDTRDESVQRGLLRAEWAREWNSYLEENGCNAHGPCTPALEDTNDDATPQMGTAVPAEQALERAIEYLAAFADGDPALVAALQSEGFVMKAAFPGDGLGEQQPTDWLGVVYQSALGTVYDEPVCELLDEGPTETAVECETTMVTTIHEQTSTPGVPTRVTVRVAADGISGLDSRYLQNFGVFGFYEWRDLHDAAITETATIDDIAELGRLDRELADQYVEYEVSTVEDMFAALDAGDLDRFLARFADGQPVLGTPSDDVRILLGALVAAGHRFDTTGCEPNGVERTNLRVECDVTVVPEPSSNGSDVHGSVTMFVGPDGVIQRNTSTLDLESV